MKAETGAAGRDGHVVDRLPAYVTRTLAAAETADVREHLAACAACRAELAGWQAIGAAARTALAAPPAAAPAAVLPDHVWAAIDASTPAGGPARRPLGRRLAGAWQVTRSQVRILPKSIWLVSALAIAAGCLAAMLLLDSTILPPTLGLVVPLVTAGGIALIYGPENDPGLEIALATRTSPRLVLLSRLGLVFGYNLGLAGGVTLVLAAVMGGDFGLLASVWAGPMFLLTGLSLLLSLGAGALTGMASAVALSCLHLLSLLLRLSNGPGEPGAAFGGVFWQTNPAILLLGVGLIIVAVGYMPRRVRIG